MPFGGGDTLLAFTDGLVERRDEDIDQGMGRLLRTLPVMAGPDLPTALDHLIRHTRDPSQDDDVAALAVRRVV